MDHESALHRSYVAALQPRRIARKLAVPAVRQAFQPDSNVATNVSAGSEPVRTGRRPSAAHRIGLQPAVADESAALSAWKG